MRTGVAPDRLTSVSHAIELSLGSPRLSPDSHRLFALLGQCPAGLAPADRTALFGDACFSAEEALLAVGLAQHLETRLDLLPPVLDYASRQCKPDGDDEAGWCRHFLSRVGDVLGEANCWLGHGDLSRASGDDAQAARHYDTALNL